MKLFSEYYAGHISHNFYLFGEDDIKFLEQFPQELWNRAIKQRYYADLPRALLAREEARNTKTLPNLKDLQGNPSTAKYYELILQEANRIQEQLTQIYNPTNARTRHRIAQNAYNNAKNQIDSMLAERKDKGGAWMEIKTVRKNYNFTIKGRHGTNVTTIPKIRTYIPELVRRIEGPKGSSSVGYDLSKIEHFDPAVSDENQNGGWRTLGFYCPQKDVISDNLQAWIGYASQGLLNQPGSIEDYESHRRKEKEQYGANIQAREEILDDTIYKNPLKNYYKNYITRLKNILRRDGDISDDDLEILYDRFSRTAVNTENEEYYAYRRACRGGFSEHLEAVVGNGNAHEFDHDELVQMIGVCEGVNVPFERILTDALADIDLITHQTPSYHANIGILNKEKNKPPELKTLPRNVDYESSTDFGILTKESPHGKIPDLTKGKVLFHVETVRRKLQAKLDKLNTRMAELQNRLERSQNENQTERYEQAMERLQDEINQIDELLNPNNPNNMIDRYGVGHHFNMGDVLENPNITPEQRRRQKVFLQFNSDREIPDILDKRDRVLGGGLYPQKNMPQSRGPGRSDLTNALRNLRSYLENPNVLRQEITKFVTKNYDGNLNILFKVFVDRNGNPTDANTYKIFTDLIKDQCLRNIGMFDMYEPTPLMISRQIKKIILHTCNRLVEKEIGESGAVRVRQGEEANAADVRREIRAMLAKTEEY